jgi:hypothetical protein
MKQNYKLSSTSLTEKPIGRPYCPAMQMPPRATSLSVPLHSRSSTRADDVDVADQVGWRKELSSQRRETAYHQYRGSLSTTGFRGAGMDFKPVTICSGDVRYGKASIPRKQLSREGDDIKPVTIAVRCTIWNPKPSVLHPSGRPNGKIPRTAAD